MSHEDDSDDIRLARSGVSNATGKLTRRLDIPVSEEMEDMVISRAVAAERPRAEFTRDLLQQALTAPQLIGLPVPVRAQLDVLATIAGAEPHELATDLLRRAVRDGFNMIQSIARERMELQSDDSPDESGRRHG
jgi:hypothetical protein